LRRDPSRAGVPALIERAFRDEWGRVLATLIGLLGDFELAEEAVQDAFALAAERWPRDGSPDNPRAWLVTVARRRAIDRIRREKVLAEKLRALEEPVVGEEPMIADVRLELLFTCCHPALAREAQVALTLRTLGGLSTEEIASAFLVAPETMKRRLTRAKAKIRGAGIPFTMPDESALPERLASVLAVVYLIFNAGYDGRGELAAEAIRLGRVLASLLPEEPEVRGLLALMLLHDARRGSRVVDGELVLLGDQDRAAWDAGRIAEGRALLGSGGPYGLQAAIASLQLEPAIDWPRVVALYTELERVTGSPVVALNRAVAVAEAGDAEAALALVDALPLDGYRYLHTTRAELLRRLGREGAREEYERALSLGPTDPERRFLQRRLAALSQLGGPRNLSA
jgi:RNA polymerase sigma-70 factor (ECF subfamily)